MVIMVQYKKTQTHSSARVIQDEMEINCEICPENWQCFCVIAAIK